MKVTSVLVYRLVPFTTMLYRSAASLLAYTYSASAFHSTIWIHRGIQHAANIDTSSRLSAITSNGPAFCEKCGTKTKLLIPKGDERERHVCGDPACGFVSYQNPKVVVGAICTHKDRVLLCQRAIEPCAGKWGYPQGFLEMGETSRQGAARETWEESGVKFDPSKAQLLAIYNLAGIQIQMIYRVEVESDEFEAGHESSDVKFVDWDDIPWDELAFPTVQWGFEHARAMKDESKPTIQERSKMTTMDGNWKLEEG